MQRAVAARPRTYLRKPTAADAEEFVGLAAAARTHLRPFVYATEDVPAFRSWLARGRRADVEQFLVCRREDDAIAGFVNLNNIILGSLRQASAGWASLPPHAGRGHLTDGLSMVLELAFTQLRLHRVEANIQPANERSRQLALRCQFRLEGYSPSYLKVGGQWRDHERWAVLSDEWRAHRRRR